MILPAKIIFWTLFRFSGFILSSGYDNLSDKKPAFQKTTSTAVGSGAEKAVDGNQSTCTLTTPIGPNTGNDRMWWYVDLGDIYSVYNININFKDMGKENVLRQRGRFAGFSLYLSNTTKKEDGYMCYKDGPELPPLNFTTNLDCIGHTRYVIYYNERLSGVTYPQGYGVYCYTQLCEVVVEGCSRGKYGINCEMDCPIYCFGTGCDIVHGTCMNCKSGWEGERCQTSCPRGSYGQECKFKCSGHCKDRIPCDHVTGECVGGCVSGWTGTMCNKICDNGRYGINCTSKCSGLCLNGEPCNKETGYCDSGCSDGYIGNVCKNECTPGWFGKQCKEPCSGHCAENGPCNHVDGICSRGCEDGYTGLHCIKPCKANYYGMNCSSVCSSLCMTPCRHTDGSCVCRSGWMDSPFCNKRCPPYTYGENCAHTCSRNCANDTCDRFNGTCFVGCKEPYYGDRCQLGQTSSTSDDTAANNLSLMWILVIVISITFNTFACIAYIFSKRKRIARIWTEKRGDSEVYVNRIQNNTTEAEDKHNYQQLDISGNNEQNYINFELNRM